MTKTYDNFEMANHDDVPGIIAATQRSVCTAMKNIVKDLQVETKAPGMTWEQIYFLIDGMEKKQPTIINQADPL